MSCVRYLTLGASVILLAGLVGCATPVATDELTVPADASTSAKQEVTVDPRAYQNFERALVSLKSGKNAEAEAELKEIIRAYPELSGPRANLGMLYLRLGRLPLAEEALKQAIQLNPNEPVYYNQLGIVLRQTGRFEEARKAYESAIALNPNYSNAHLNLGILFDIYLRDAEQAQIQYLSYQGLIPEEDKLVTKWMIDLKQRTQAAAKTPAKGG